MHTGQIRIAHEQLQRRLARVLCNVEWQPSLPCSKHPPVVSPCWQRRGRYSGGIAKEMQTEGRLYSKERFKETRRNRRRLWELPRLHYVGSCVDDHRTAMSRTGGGKVGGRAAGQLAQIMDMFADGELERCSRVLVKGI